MLERINADAHLNRCVRSGLQAIKNSDKSKFVAKDTRKLQLSIDIDSCFSEAQPNAHRWDYLVITTGDIVGHFVEVHPAGTGEVSKVIAKKQWLTREVIGTTFRRVASIRYRISWVATNAGVHILPTSREYKLLAKENLLPLKRYDFSV